MFNTDTGGPLPLAWIPCAREGRCKKGHRAVMTSAVFSVEWKCAGKNIQINSILFPSRHRGDGGIKSCLSLEKKASDMITSH